MEFCCNQVDEDQLAKQNRNEAHVVMGVAHPENGIFHVLAFAAVDAHLS
jgi:hypothetical protein